MSREDTGDLQEMHSEELSSRQAISPATTCDSAYGMVSGRSAHWLKVKNPAAPAVRRLEEEDWN
jgi:hypothetical protein